MIIKKVYLLLIFLFFCGCSIVEVDKLSDITIVSVNVLIGNKNSAFDITSNLLDFDADVYLLHEAVVGINVDRDLFIEYGYTVFSHELSDQDSYNGVLVSRVPAEYGSLDFSYNFKHIFTDEYTSVAPFYALRLEVESIPISIIGAHIPHILRNSLEINELRVNAYRDIDSIIIDGRIAVSSSVLKVGDGVIFGGDLNTFPTDPVLDSILDSGMEDSFLANPDKYDFTWSPIPGGPNLARIDYIFHSEFFSAVFHDCISIPGSDHKGIIVGVNIK